MSNTITRLTALAASVTLPLLPVNARNVGAALNKQDTNEKQDFYRCFHREPPWLAASLSATFPIRLG